MRLLHSRGVCLILVVAAALAGGLGGEFDPDSTPERIVTLVEQLGDNVFAKREAATRELDEIGEPALPALRKVAESDDLEVRRRAQRLIRGILMRSRFSKSLGMKLALVEPGEFQMGSPMSERGRRADETQHRVRITRPYLIGLYEVSQSEYEKVMRTNPSWFSPTGSGKDKVKLIKTDRLPVEQVTWFDAVEFCNRLSRSDGYRAYYRISNVKRESESIKSAKVEVTESNGYRLPTEAEWEYACRAETVSLFNYGNSNTGREANLRPGFATGYGAPTTWTSPSRTVPVSEYKPNRWGLYNVHGNVAEWCGDWYDREYYQKSPIDDPQGPKSGDHRVVRGGSWMVNEASCRSASRYFLTPGDAANHVGFRVARTP